MTLEPMIFELFFYLFITHYDRLLYQMAQDEQDLRGTYPGAHIFSLINQRRRPRKKRRSRKYHPNNLGFKTWDLFGSKTPLDPQYG